MRYKEKCTEGDRKTVEDDHLEKNMRWRSEVKGGAKTSVGGGGAAGNDQGWQTLEFVRKGDSAREQEGKIAHTESSKATGGRGGGGGQKQWKGGGKCLRVMNGDVFGIPGL